MHGAICPASPKRSITLAGEIKYREVAEDVEGTSFRHIIAEIHAASMNRLSKVETPDDPSDGASNEESAIEKEHEP